MNSRRKFIKDAGLGFATFLAPPVAMASPSVAAEGLVVKEDEGEKIYMRDGTAVVKIKIGRNQGSDLASFLTESFRPGDELPVHKHLNEDEVIFVRNGTGLLTIGEKQLHVGAGAIMFIPMGVWHGIKNIGQENFDMVFSYTPSGFEGFFREVGTPEGKPFVRKTFEERRAIAKKWGMIYKHD